MIKVTKVFFTVLLAALLAFVAVAALAEEAKQVYFEQFSAPSAGGSLPAGWSFHSYQEEYFQKAGASYAEVTELGSSPERGGVLHMFAAEDDDAAAFITVAVEPSSVYRISCYIKTAGVMCDSPENAGDPAGANIALRGNLIVRSSGIMGSSDWQLAEIVGATASGQSQITVSCRIGGYSSVARGEAWFDDFKIEKLTGYTGQTVALYAGEDAGEGGSGESATGGGSAAVVIGIAVAAVIGAAVAAGVAAAKKAKKRASGNDISAVKYGDEAETGCDGRALVLAKIRGRSFWQGTSLMPEPTDGKLHFVKLDWIFVTVLTLVYAVIAMFRLGTLNFPTSSFSASAGQTVRISFDNSAVISAVWQNSGVSYSDYTLTADNGEKIAISSSDDPSSYWHMFKWKKLEVPAGMTATSGVTLTVISGDAGRPREADLVLNELAFFDENGNLIPCRAEGAAAAIVDEQSTVPEFPGYYNGMYFDEVYHARTAYEHLNNLNVYEWTHPPLGKLLISVGIMIFGMKPFGWRFMGAFFGILMVPLMYCFAKRIVKRPQLSLLATVLFTFDFMHFAQTRIATVDTYALFFTLLMTYYMYRFICTDIGDGIGKMLKPLALSGLFFGLGCASKWTCIYTGAALAVLFFGKLILLFVQSIRTTAGDPEHRNAIGRFVPRAVGLCAWCLVFFIAVPALIYGASYCRYYTAQWKPAEQQRIAAADPSRGGTADEVKLTAGEALDTYVKGVIQNQKDMYGYHSGLDSEHKASSPWWMWIFNLRPTWFYVTYVPQYTVTFNDWDGFTLKTQTVNVGESASAPKAPARQGYTFVGWDKSFDDIKANTTVNAVYSEGTDSSAAAAGVRKTETVTTPQKAGTISTFGNPAVWNLCFVGVICMVITLIIRRRFTMEAAFLFVCIGAALLPWVFVTRSTYAYHYFSTVPYIILASAYALKYFEDMAEFRADPLNGGNTGLYSFVSSIKYVWMALAVLLFVLFFPVISGVEVPKEYIGFLQWIPFKKIELKDLQGNVTRTLRMGWTFLGYGD